MLLPLRNIVVLLLFLFSVSDFAFAQKPADKDDSLKLYRDIENFSNKSKTTRFLYRIFFRPVDVPPPEQNQKNDPQVILPSYSQYEGKIIRRIQITPLDPFGYSANDTVVAHQNFLYEIGNKAHVRTQRITIKNLLLIHKNEPFDSLRVKESERLIRSQKYIQAVQFSFKQVHADSVDIYIRAVDKWSLIPEGAISTSSFTIGLKEKNFWGLGHEFENVFTRNYNEAHNSFSTNYYIPNIKNTYINTTLSYAINEHKSISRSAIVDRPFYSPLAKWAGGFSYMDQFQSNTSTDLLVKSKLTDIRYNAEDYWLGRAWQIFKGNTEDQRTTNLILSGRFLRVQYMEKPAAIYDTTNMYSNENFYLASIGVSRRRYIKDKYIFNYGFIEDVPVGNVYELTGGYQERITGRLYGGARIASGNYHDWGYLSWHLELGAFFRTSQVEQGVFMTGFDYFTNLFSIGDWHFRQFIKPQYTMGVNRFPYEKITINNENGLRGFSSTSLTGTKKILLTLQTQSYAPWSILGFRFGPYLVHSLGMLGDEASSFKSSQVFSQFGAGFLIKNDFLVYNFFQVSVAYYPTIPGDGKNVFKINVVANTDFGFQDYIIGKPSTLAYQ